MLGAFASLRSRLTAAVMVPLLALVATFGGLTCWVIHNSMATTSDRILIGSVRLLSRAVDTDAAVRYEVFPLAVHLLQRRSAPVTYYSVFHGRQLLAGMRVLAPPPDYRVDNVSANNRHPAATFPITFRDTHLIRGYVEPQDATRVIQPAYLRYGVVMGKPARIATEIRMLRGDPHPVVVQVADFLDDRWQYEQSKFLQVISAGILIALTAVLLFYWAITWGLTPFAALTSQIEASRGDPPLDFRLGIEPNAPREAQLLTRAFNGLLERTERAIASLRQFTANASHQMRTPLAIVRVHLDVLDRYGADSPRGRNAVTDIGDAAASLERLLLQLISLARAEEQAIDPDICFDLAAVAVGVVEDRILQIAEGGIEIVFERTDDRPLLARGEAMLAAEMVGNLVDNAVRYNRPGGTVTIHLARADDRVVVEVEDDGPGIPKADRDRVWERFYRIEQGGRSDGSGLGLPIVRALAERMGATTHLAEGENEQGLCVTIGFLSATWPGSDRLVRPTTTLSPRSATAS